MNFFEYYDYLSNISDSEIYNLIKKFLIRDHFGYFVDENYFQAVYEQARKRKPNLFYDALQDALVTIHNWDYNMSETKVIEIKRIDYLNDYEIRELISTIGAAKKNPPLDFSNLKHTAIDDIFGIKSENMLFCRVGGDSMIKANIYDGSTLIIDTGKAPKNDEIVVIAINDELFVKRIVFGMGKIALISENDAYEPYEIRNDDNYKIIGVVKHIIQNL